jgi:PIN domain nuclease of toxin-antitoxin system
VNLLLDTHAFVWWNFAPRELGTAAREAIADPDNQVFVSAVSVWEIAMKRRAGRLQFSASPVDAIARGGFFPLPISPAHAERVADLPLLHRDPFDRMLVAQAQLDSLTLVTADAHIAAYPVAQLWAGRARR